MHDCLIAFGSNQGNRLEVLQNAVKYMADQEGISIVATSRPYRTLPVGGPSDQEPYLNAAIRIETLLNPSEVHQILIKTETHFGRLRPTGSRWGSRKIDLDLLLFDQRQLKTPELTVPHPRMSFRRFVLEPACEIAKEMIHVPSGRTLGQLVSHLEERENLVLCFCEPDSALPNEPVGSELERLDVDSNWEVRLITDSEQMRQSWSDAKLVTYFEHQSVSSTSGQSDGNESRFTESDAEEKNNDRSFWSEMVSFSGPTLALPRQMTKAKVEIFAAIEAMGPLQGNDLDAGGLEQSQDPEHEVLP